MGVDEVIPQIARDYLGLMNYVLLPFRHFLALYLDTGTPHFLREAEERVVEVVGMQTDRLDAKVDVPSGTPERHRLLHPIRQKRLANNGDVQIAV